MSIAQRIVTRFFQLDDVDKASFSDGDVPQYSTATGKLEGVPLPAAGMTNPMIVGGDMIIGANSPGGAPQRLGHGLLGQVLTIIIAGAHQIPGYANPIPGYEQQPYVPPSSGTATMPEDAFAVRVPNLTGDLHLTLRDAYNLNISQVIVVKAGLLSGHALTLATQDGNLIDGSSTHAITADYGALQLMGDANLGVWRIVGAYLTT